MSKMNLVFTKFNQFYWKSYLFIILFPYTVVKKFVYPITFSSGFILNFTPSRNHKRGEYCKLRVPEVVLLFFFIRIQHKWIWKSYTFRRWLKKLFYPFRTFYSGMKSFSMIRNTAENCKGCLILVVQKWCQIWRFEVSRSGGAIYHKW